MEHTILIPLNTNTRQAESLRALQALFAQACSEIAVTVRETRCWNRVALHHMVYKSMRERFPNLGSQMVCNAIYSVSRTCRLVLQHPASPFFQAKSSGQMQVPQLKFAPSAPVYFDRHTLSLKGGSLSLYTLDGRLRFEVSLTPEQELLFKTEKLTEVSLMEVQGGYRLHFRLGEKMDAEKPSKEDALQLPDYVLIDQDKEGNPMMEQVGRCEGTQVQGVEL